MLVIVLAVCLLVYLHMCVYEYSQCDDLLFDTEM